ncbi:MAG: RNA polymerase sigma factor [Oscillospiraceae bacterium]|nr:RNA polymerase sigma factor [Oscillospiraceae bacterium]
MVGYSLTGNEYIKYILDTYSKMIVRLAFTYTKSLCDAEDIAQDVFVSLIEKNKTFENSEHEKAWLIRVTVNKSKNFVKSSWVKKTVPIDEAMTKTSEEKSDDILEEVLKMPEKYRTVIHLFYYEGYSINEIAEILGKSTGTIGTWLSRGRKILKERLEGGFTDE